MDPAPQFLRTRLALFYIAIFAVLGTWLPYFPLWLRSKGWGESEIGTLLAIGIWVRVGFLPWFAGRVDQSGKRRAAMIAMSWLSVAVLLPFLWAESFWEFAIWSLAFGFTYPVLIPLCDSMTELSGRRYPGLRYSRIRLWGSISFLVTVTLLGSLIETQGTELVVWTALGALGCAGIFAIALPGLDVARPQPGGRPVRELLADPGFLTVLLAVGVVQTSHAAYYGFASLHWQGAGIDEGTIGLLWAEGVIAEVILFAFAVHQVERLGPRNLILLGAGAAAIRWALLANTTAVIPLFAINWLHALSFGATHLGAILYIQRNIPHDRSTTAQSLFSAVATGAGMALGTMLSGWLYEQYQGGVFFAMIALALLGAAIATRLKR